MTKEQTTPKQAFKTSAETLAAIEAINKKEAKEIAKAHEAFEQKKANNTTNKEKEVKTPNAQEVKGQENKEPVSKENNEASNVEKLEPVIMDNEIESARQKELSEEFNLDYYRKQLVESEDKWERENIAEILSDPKKYFEKMVQRVKEVLEKSPDDHIYLSILKRNTEKLNKWNEINERYDKLLDNTVKIDDKNEEPELETTVNTETEEAISSENNNEVEKNLEINSLKNQIAERNERARQIEMQIAVLEDNLKKEALEKNNEIEVEPEIKIENTPEQELSELKNQIDEVWEEYEKTPAWKFWKVNSLNKKIDTLDEKYSLLEKELQMEKVRSDMKERPFLYYAAHEITSPEIIKVLKNKTTETYDFSNIKTTSKNGIAYGAFTSLQKIGEEGFFVFNNLGFLLIIKNIEKLKTEKGIDIRSEEGMYKIVGPDGTIISDNINGYAEAFTQFEQVSERYAEKLKEEFNKEK